MIVLLTSLICIMNVWNFFLSIYTHLLLILINQHGKDGSKKFFFQFISEVINLQKYYIRGYRSYDVNVLLDYTHTVIRTAHAPDDAAIPKNLFCHYPKLGVRSRSVSSSLRTKHHKNTTNEPHRRALEPGALRGPPALQKALNVKHNLKRRPGTPELTEARQSPFPPCRRT